MVGLSNQSCEHVVPRPFDEILVFASLDKGMPTVGHIIELVSPFSQHEYHHGESIACEPTGTHGHMVAESHV